MLDDETKVSSPQALQGIAPINGRRGYLFLVKLSSYQSKMSATTAGVPAKWCRYKEQGCYIPFVCIALI